MCKFMLHIKDDIFQNNIVVLTYIIQNNHFIPNDTSPNNASYLNDTIIQSNTTL